MEDITYKIGTAFIDEFGGYCLEAVNGGYKLDDLYDGGNRWGDFNKVLMAVAVLRGATLYVDYLRIFRTLTVPGHKPVNKQTFSRFTGVRVNKMDYNQVAYNKTYRNKTRTELDMLRTLNAYTWIDNNLDAAKAYIANK